MSETNCVVLAIAKITGRAPADIAGEIALYPARAGGPAFDAKGGCAVWSFGQWLEARGWTLEFPRRGKPLSLPPVALLTGADSRHAFALMNGRLFGADRCRDDDRIDLIAIPPEGTK